jgi:uncharacterized protein YegJ (DUF2314 family)
MRALLLLACLVAAMLALRADDPVIGVDADDAQMNAAIAHAKATLPSFLKIFQANGADSYSIKVPITDKGQTEYFWLSDISYAGGKFTGTIDNDPELVHNVKLGQKMTVESSQVADWLYMKGDKMYGNFTVRVLLPKMSPEDRAKIQALMAPE